MKRRVDLEKAAEGEIFGALAVGRSEHRSLADEGGFLTNAQKRAAGNLAEVLVDLTRNASARGELLQIGDLHFELRQHGTEEVLSIHKPATR